MKPFLDITGASARTYRFRLVSDQAALPATAGNVVLVRHTSGQPSVVACGSSRSLAHSREEWLRAGRELGADSLYVRLNVSTAIRAAEHDDIVAACHPKMVLAEAH